MKLLKIIVLFILFLCPTLNFGQESTSIPERTPEQEAAKQTEKLQQELNLSTEQARQVHEINLKYARARKVSNTRMDAIQRIKDKEVELSRVLSEQQQSVLQNKRYERSSFQSNDNRQVNTAVRQPTDNSNQTNRYNSTGTNQRSEPQTESSRNAAKTNEYERSAPNVRQSYTQPRTTQPAITTRPNTTDNSRSTYRNPTENRSSSVRSAAPTVNSAPKSSSGQSSSRSSSPTQQPSNTGRR
jgi:predicted Holliday junction resolvase-like endonuclease